jgi:hypothetical protein
MDRLALRIRTTIHSDLRACVHLKLSPIGNHRCEGFVEHNVTTITTWTISARHTAHGVSGSRHPFGGR